MGRRTTEQALRKVDCEEGRQRFVADGIEMLELESILKTAWDFLCPQAAARQRVCHDGHDL